MQEAKEMYNDGQINTNLQDFNDKYEIFGGAVDYFASLKGWGISAGGKVSAISDNGYYLTNEIDASSSKLMIIRMPCMQDYLNPLQISHFQRLYVQSLIPLIIEIRHIQNQWKLIFQFVSIVKCYL